MASGIDRPMLIYLLAFVGGVLTILSPCILPVLPFVFARADQPFRRSGLPLLVGMALTFSLVAIAAAFGGHWVVRLNQGGRYVAMVVFLCLGVSLLLSIPGRSIDSAAGARWQPTSGRSFNRERASGNRLCWEFLRDCFGLLAPVRSSV